MEQEAEARARGAEAKAEKEKVKGKIVVYGFGGVMVLSLFGLLFGALLNPDVMVIDSDAWHYYMPIKARVADLWRDPGLFLWEPGVDCGRPSLADPTTAALYPGTLLFLFLPGVWAWKLFVFAHLFIALFSSYSMAKSFAADDRGAFFGALIYVGSGAVVSHHWSPIWWAGIAWLPLAIAQLRALLHEAATLKRAVLTALIVALMILAGSFEPLLAFIYYAAFELCLKLGYDWRAIRRGQRSQLAGARPYLCLALAALLSVALGACQLLPSFEFLGLCERATGGGSEQAARWSLSYWRLLELVAPGIFGSPEQGFYWLQLFDRSMVVNGEKPFLAGIYVGTPALILALTGLFVARQRDRIVLALALIVTVLLALGQHSPIFFIARATSPGISLFRYPEKILTISMAFLSVAAGLGFSASLAGQRVIIRRLAYAALIALMLAALGAFFARNALLQGSEGIIWGSVKASLIWAFVVSGGFTLLQFIPVSSARMKTLFLVLSFLLPVTDLGFANSKLKSLRDLRQLRTAPDSLSRIKGSDTRKLRLATRRPRSFVRIVPHHLVSLGFHSVDGYGSARLSGRRRFDRNFPLSLEPRRLQLCAASMTLEPSERSPGPERFDPNGVRVRAIQGGARFRLLRQLQFVQDDDQAALAIRAANFDPNVNLSVVTKKNVRTELYPAASETLIVKEVTAVSLLLETQCSEKRALLICDTYYPDWYARVDGKEVPVYRANLCFRAVLLEPGRHTIEWSYRPRAVVIGCVVSGLAMLVAVLLFFLSLGAQGRSIDDP
jgi:hypothetical protein